MFSRFLTIITILIISPLIIFLSILIIIEDGFPIFFVQKRVGSHNKLFKIFKFRTMLKSTPNVATNDLNKPEKFILKSGKYLRKLSLDEIPNLFNVIMGEMNFVGPRPALPSQIDLNSKREKLGIHKLKPGITGWAQINGRDEIPIDKKVELDLYYLENKSLLLDARIIFKTIFKVFKSSNISH